MSVLNPNSEEEPQECPLCMEFLELDDINFYPCSCGYQVRSSRYFDESEAKNRGSLLFLPDLPLLLEQNPNRGQRQLPRVQISLRRKPGRLQAPDGRGAGQDKGREAAKGPGQEAEDLRKPKTPGQRQGGPAESGLRGRALAETGGRRRAQKTRVLWQVWEDPQSRDQPQYRNRFAHVSPSDWRTALLFPFHKNPNSLRNQLRH